MNSGLKEIFDAVLDAMDRDILAGDMTMYIDPTKKEARNCWTCGNVDCRLERLPHSFGLFDCPGWEEQDD